MTDHQWAMALEELRRKLAADSWTVNPMLARENDFEFPEGFEEDWAPRYERE